MSEPVPRRFPRREIVRLAGVAAAALFVPAGPALALDARDRSFGPGRVGAIVKHKTRPADLAAIYGADNVRKTTVHAIGGGEESPGAFVHYDTADALEITFTDDGERIATVSVLGKNWVSRAGLRNGTSLSELERINGGPFELAGFGWDYGGQVFARGPALKGLEIFMSPSCGSTKARDAVTGERKFSSRHAAMKELDPRVILIRVQFG